MASFRVMRAILDLILEILRPVFLDFLAYLFPFDFHVSDSSARPSLEYLDIVNDKQEYIYIECENPRLVFGPKGV